MHKTPGEAPTIISGKRSGPSLGSRPTPTTIKPDENLEAGLEGLHNLLGKVGDPEEGHIVVPSPEPIKSPTALFLPLAGLARLFGRVLSLFKLQNFSYIY